MNVMRLRLTFQEGLLGTKSANPELVRDYIASTAPTAELTDAEVGDIPPVDVDDELEKGTTVFARTECGDGDPFVYDYQIKGFFKDACGVLRRVKAMRSEKVKAYKKVIDGLIFPVPRQIRLLLPEGGELGICERPLRTSGPTGERVALARSEEAPPGTTIEFEVQYLQDDLEKTLIEWLDYGKLRGLGQWRNSGKGRFSYEILEGE